MNDEIELVWNIFYSGVLVGAGAVGIIVLIMYSVGIIP